MPALKDFSIGDEVEHPYGGTARVGCIHEDRLYLTGHDHGGSLCDEHGSRWECVEQAGIVDHGGVGDVPLKLIKKSNESKETIMSNIVEFFQNITASKEDKLLKEYGLENPIGTPTEKGLELSALITYKANRAEIIKTAEAMKKEEKK